MENKQTLLFRLYQVLCDYSDIDHPLTQQDILSCLERDYGLIVERKAIGRNVSYLREMGYDIVSTREGSYLAERTFEYSELRMLIDSVLSSSHINATNSKELMNKLIKLGGRNFKPHVKHVVSVSEWNKTINHEVFLNVEIVDEAIEEKCQIIFDYNKVGVDKKLHKTAHHIISPYQMLLHNQHYYLMGFEDKWKNIAFYRMDKITNVTKLEDKKAMPMKDVPELKNGINYKELSTARPYMFADKPERIIIKAEQWLMDDIVDWFGYDVKAKITPDDKLEVELYVSPLAMEYWAMQYGTNAEIIFPKSLRDNIKNRIDAMQEKYKG